MVTVSHGRRQTIMNTIITALKDTLNEELAELSVKSPQSCFDCVTEVISALSFAVKSAFREFSEEWNTANGDPLITLPTELTLECFRLLDPGERITVSHVSRLWRKTALLDCHLWNEYAISRVRWDSSSAVDGIATMLARSDPLPFHFASYIWPNNLPDAFLDVLCANIGRMATLRLDGGFARLAQQDAPILSKLTYVNPHTWRFAPELPADWAALRAPRLEVLDIVGINIPADLQPLRALRRFRGQFQPDGLPDFSFLAAMQELSELELSGATREFLDKLHLLPPRLTVLKLTGIITPVSYAPLLQACRTRRILVLSIEHADVFEEALELFVQQSSERRTLEMTSDWLYLRDSARGMVWSIGYMIPVHLTAKALAHLHFFSSLALPLPEFLDLHALPLSAWNRRLPALRSLTLSLPGPNEDTTARYSGCTSSTSGIDMPALESLMLRSSSQWDDELFVNWLRSDAPTLLGAILDNCTQPLASIQMQAAYPFWGLLRQDVAPLFPLAERIVVLSADYPQQTTIFVDEQQDAGPSD